MISNGKELYTFLDKIFRVHGFIRQKDTYYFYTAECICFFNIGKSEFGGHYDHVMGCFLKEINKEKDEFPKYNKNHLSYVIDEIIGKDIVTQAFDLEDKLFKGTEREDMIQYLIENYVIPFLKDIGSKDGIKMSINKYLKLKYYMKVTLKKALSIPLED